MSKSIKVTVHTESEQSNQSVDAVKGSGQKGNPTRIRAIKNARYQLQDTDSNNVAPEKVSAKRVGKNLHLSFEDAKEADLIIDGYYDVHPLGEASSNLYGQAADGSMYEYIAGAQENASAIATLTDGGKAMVQVLGNEAAAFELSALPLVAPIAPGLVGVVGGAAAINFFDDESQPAELALLRDAAQNNNAAAPAITAKTYAAASVKGVTDANVDAINSVLNSAGVDGAATDTAAELQAIVDAYNAILNNAGDAANTAANVANPTKEQYAAIGVKGVSSTAAVNLLGDAIDGKNKDAVDSVAEVQALADAANAVMSGAAGGTAPTLAQLQLLGITGVTADNLPAVLAAINASADDGTGVDSLSELQKVVSDAADAAATALTKIKDAAEGNTAGTAPEVADFVAAGVNGVDADNLAAISSVLNSGGVNGAAADTTAEVQAIVNGFNAILANAGDAANTAADVTNPTQEQYAAIGVTGVSSAATVSLLGDAIDGKNKDAVDSVAEVQALADAANAVMSGAAGGTAPTLAQLQLLGITGVTADNLPAVLAAIKASADDGTGVDSLSKVQDVVTTAANAAATALTKIKDAADANNAGATPAVTDFAAAGVTGVDADNLAAVSSALNSAGVNGAAATTTAQVQAIVDGFNAIKANAGDAANTAANVTNPTQAQYAAIGVTGVSTANAESLLGDAIDGKAFADVDTVGEVQALADAANAVLTGAAGGAAPTLAQLQLLGITGVTADNLPAVLAAIKASADDGTGVNSLSALQSVVSGAVTAFNTASTAIENFAQDNGAGSTPSPAPTAANYTAMGVSGIGGVGQPTVAQINSALASSGVTGAKANTAAEVQAIVDGFSAIVANADGTADNNATNPTQAQYEAIGVTGIDSEAELGLLGDVIDAKGATDVDTTGKVQALADAVQAVQTGTATVAQLEALGITGANAQNIASINAALSSGASSLSALQTIVSGANDAPVNTVSSAQSTNEDIAKVITGLQIADADAGTNDMSVTLAVAHGTITVAAGTGVTTATNGTASVTLTGKLADINTLLATANAVTYTPTNNYNGSDTLTMTTSDGGNTGTGGTLTDADTVAITVNAANDAPVLADKTLSFAAVSQSTTAPAAPTGVVGSLVSSFVSGVSDVDASPLQGIAITGVNSNGKLFFSTDGGTTWTEATGVSDSAALLLASNSNTRLIFQPNANFAGTVDAITFRAWDTTSGTAGSKVDTTTNGNTTAVSTATDTVSQHVVTSATISAVSTDNVVVMNEALPLSGKAEANADVTIGINGTTHIVKADGSGNWTYDAKLVPEVRYVMVRNTNTTDNIFNIDEIEVFVNGGKISGGIAVDTGVGITKTGTTAKVTEGIITNATLNQSFFESSGDAWVQLDLGGYFRADSIVVTPRVGQVGRLNGDKIYTSINDMSGMTAAQLDAAVALASPTVFSTTITGTTSVPEGPTGMTISQPNSLAKDPLVNGSNTITVTQTADGVTSTSSQTVTWVASNAPTLDSTPALSLSAVAQDAATPTGAVGSLVSSFVGGISDADTAAVKGIAITGVNTNGKLFYSTNGGTTWTQADADISNTKALLLSSDTDNRIYFKPNTSFFGTVAEAVTFRAWDKTSTEVEGTYASTSTNGANTAFSTATDTISEQVVRNVTLSTVSTDSQVTGREALVLSGVADAGATVSGTINSTAFNTTADSSGNWSVNTGKVRFIMIRDLLQPVSQSAAQETDGIVSISDVKAFDSVGNNVAKNKTVLMSKKSDGINTPWADNGASSLVDENVLTIAEVLGSDATSTNGDVWFQVDLGAEFELSSIQILARQDSITNPNTSRYKRMDGTEVYTSITTMSGMTRAELDASSTVNSAIIDTVNGTVSTYTFNSPNTSSNSSLTTGSNTITINQTVSSVSSQATATVTKVADPVFTSSGSASVAENVATTTTVYDATANTDTGMTYTLRGTDSARFDINSSTGAVTFKASPNFEAPVDIGTNNVYNFTVRATNSAGGYADQAVVVTVTDVAAAPVVIDVNRDGALTYGNVAMDISGDGHLDQTAWAGSADGVLVWDKFADGQVHNNSQYAFAQYKTTANADGSAVTDLQGLAAAFDTNHDGVFDAKDAKFAEFKVWQDANQNGVSEAGEVRSLADVGISSIDLTSDGIKRNPAAGVTEAGRTTAVATDGSEVLVADAAFEYRSLDYTVDAGHLNLLGAGVNLDLASATALHGAISSVDVNGSGANTLKINLADVLPSTTLKVQGGSDDTVALFQSEGWSQSGTATDAGVVYNVWHNTSSTDQLLIDQHMHVTTA